MIPLFWPVIYKDEFLNSLSEVFETRWIGEGPKTKEFEKEFGKKFNYDYCLSVNSGTSALELAFHLADLNNRDEVLTTVLTCLHGQETILMSDGSYRKIRDLVESKSKEKVLSFNNITKEYEEKEIIGWYEHDLGDKEWYSLSHTNSQKTNSTKLNRKSCILTNDHKVMTKRGYVKVEDLTETDMVLTKYKNLNEKQKEFFVGTLLGDSNISSGRSLLSSCRFGYRHNLAQKEWVDIKDKALKGIEITKEYRDSYKQSGPYEGSYTKMMPFLSEEKNLWYPDGKKIVPKYIENYFSPLALATWYMDDGSYFNKKESKYIGGVVLCTESFIKNDVEFLINLLFKKFNIKSHLQKNKSGWRIYIGNGNNGGKLLEDSNVENFFRIITKYIPHSMRYKVPNQISDQIPFDENLWDLGSADLYFDNITVQKIDKLSQSYKNNKKCYCIDVKDNHNFISKNMVMHNCSATNLPLMRRKCKVVFVDIDPNTLNMDYEDLKRKITDRTKAVVTVNLGGIQCDKRIYKLLKEKNITSIIDCCQSLGIPEENGDYLAYSFQAIKHFSTFDGGMLITRNEKDYLRGKKLRWFGIDREQKILNDWKCYNSNRQICMDMKEAGYKFHMNDVSASIGLIGLKHSDEILSHRKSVAEIYKNTLKVPTISGGSYWLFCILIDNKFKILDELRTKNIECDVSQLRNDVFTVFGSKKELPNMDKIEKKYLYIPINTKVTLENAKYISKTINEVI